ncbi:MAG TPA: restriction endonuclease subunit S [Pirellulaceae bacterium]|nr:restriction endonuclease subunit S [Pirellulaceae bacterium]HMO94343.1 restriction endonuclease subunit S [Pirellulaceae bacterium]HMP69644.1 restriction endonuclease subunit S [Pirellulaceae bacterium]
MSPRKANAIAQQQGDELEVERDLPEGWRWQSLEEVCTKIQDGTHHSPKNQARTGKYRYITAKNIKIWGVDLTDVTYVDEHTHREIHNRCDAKKGDVLYIKDGATTGIATLNPFDEEISLLSSVALLKPKEGILSSLYLKWWLNSPVGYKSMTDQMSGSAITRLILRTIRKSRIPLPPLAEQRRIVSKLEEVLGKVRQSQQRLARIPALLKRFRQSVLAAACSGKLTADWREVNPVLDNQFLGDSLASLRENLWRQRASRTGRRRTAYKPPFLPAENLNELPSTWTSVTVSQVAILDQGFAFKSSEFAKSGIRLLRGENLEPGKLRWIDTRYWPEVKIGEFKQFLIEEGEIILALDRPVISTGLKIARATKNDLPCLLVQRMMRFKMVDPQLGSWLFFNLNLPAFIQHLSSGLTGSDLPHVTGTGVAEYTFGLPPLPEQHEIVRRVEQLFALADQIEARFKKAQTQVDRLTQSILAKAFRGELVPTEAELARRENRSYEPASELLARIQAEKSSHPQPHSPKRGEGSKSSKRTSRKR